jgi:hypothetical protein
LSETESEYESPSDPEAEDKLPMGNFDTKTACKKKERWKNENGTPHVHLLTSLHGNLFVECLA